MIVFAYPQMMLLLRFSRNRVVCILRELPADKFRESIICSLKAITGAGSLTVPS